MIRFFVLIICLLALAVMVKAQVSSDEKKVSIPDSIKSPADDFEEWLSKEKRILLHAGGQSREVSLSKGYDATAEARSGCHYDAQAAPGYDTLLPRPHAGRKEEAVPSGGWRYGEQCQPPLSGCPPHQQTPAQPQVEERAPARETPTGFGQLLMSLLSPIFLENCLVLQKK